MTVTTTWEDIAAAKVAAREAKIPDAWRLKTPVKGLNVMEVPRTCGILTDRELEITESCAVDLVSAMVSKTFSAEEVAIAFCKRAAIAHQLTNCLTEIFFEQGIAQARALDAEYASTGKPRGLLHGLPVSLKDAINVKGLDATVGFISHCNLPADDDAYQVKIMRDAGAVFYCKTNVPTGMLIADTYNNVWGVTTNPYNTEYGPGGSSGGEAALLALRGSPLGVGSDIGGSVRLPAAICGIYGLKPAAMRFPNLGCKSGLPGQETVRGVQGPMSADLSSLELWSKAIIAAAPWEHDPNVLPIPWNESFSLPEGKLCFGLMKDDGYLRPTPAVVRALEETKAALEAAGHKFVEWTPYEPFEGFKLLMRCLTGDGGAKMWAQVRGGEYPEPWPVGLEIFEDKYKATKDAPPTVGQLWDIQVERNNYNAKLLDSWAATREITGTGRPIDGLISPCMAFPAAPTHHFRHIGYTGLWNLADHAGVAFPVTFVHKNDTAEKFEYRNEEEKFVYDDYDPARLEGMPVGLQIIVPRHQEQRALKLGEVIDNAIKKQKQ